MDDAQSGTSDRDDTPESVGVQSSYRTDILATSRSACEACRARKIRCDKESPCLQCRRAGINCLHAATKRREKRTRILLTPQYERKIDSIETRLDDIARLLEDLKTQDTGTSETDNGNTEGSQSCVTLPSDYPSRALPPKLANATAVEGASSLSAHSVFVNDYLQTFVDVKRPDPEMQATMGNLSHMISSPDGRTEACESVLPKAQSLASMHERRKFDLPPLQNAATLIRAAQAQTLAGTGWIYEYVLMQSFGDLCLKVYYSEDKSLYDLISVNAGLYSLFWDYASTAQISQDEKERNIAYARLCRDNLEIGLANIPVHLPASANVIAALLFGAFYCVGNSTPSLSWSLSSKASELCQTLGYHRKLPSRGRLSVSPEYAQFLFWTAYYVDKSLSLRLGRASIIQDWDVTADPPASSDETKEPVLAFFALWVKTARCQGNIYEMLYSPASMMQADEVRRSRVNFLASNLHELAHETEQTRAQWLEVAKQNSGNDLMDFYAISDDILRLSLLSHVFRAAPRDAHSSATFNPDCIQAARATLDRHHDCMAVIRRASNTYFPLYVNWTLLFAPFVPFIVLFCHVMETRDGADGTMEMGVNGSAPDYLLFDPVLWTGDNAQLEDWLYTNQAASMELLEGADITLT